MNRSALAKKHYVPCTRQIKEKAIANEILLSQVVNGKHLPDDDPFDVLVQNGRKHFIEVKTIIRAKNDKVTMHPDSLVSKKKKAKRNKAKTHTFVFDERTGKLYYKKGLGSFRLSTMTEIATIKGINKYLH